MSDGHGLTDEAVTEGHDFIEHYEDEEAKAHPQTSTGTQQTADQMPSAGAAALGSESTLGQQQQQQQSKPASKMERVKEALNMKK